MSKVMPVSKNLLVVVMSAMSITANADDLTVEVSSHKAVFILGEPVVVSAVVMNGGSEPATLIHHNAPTLYSQLSVVDLMFGANRDQLKRWDDRLRPIKRTSPSVIPPGEGVMIDLVMLFNSRDGFFVTKPGEYWIQGRIVADGVGEVLSTPVPIEIREPSPSDKAAWEWLNTHKEEYGRLVQVPWEAKLSDEFIEECDRLCNASPSTYVEYLALFLSRSYREGPKKDAQQSARFAEIAKAKATSEKTRTEAEKMVRADQPRPSPSGVAESEVDPGIQRAVAECVENFASALTAGRMDECATALSEDFLYNGALDKTRALAELDGDLRKLRGAVATVRVDTFSRGPTADEIEVSGRFVVASLGREPSGQTIRWVLRREGSRWVIRRWDPAS